MAQVIQVENLKKYYKVHKKEPGFLGSLKSFISREYEEVKAVDGISFAINEGELIGFIGPNGAGKTTTLKCLSGLLYTTSGNVKVLGYSPFERKNKFLKQIAFIMGQRNQLWWDLPAIETFFLNKEIYEINEIQFKKNLNELVDLLQVKDILKIPVKKLSLGQRMKCELIASLLHSPRVLFLDEPTLGLDIVMQKALREFIKEYNKRYHATVILTSHYMDDVEALCKRVIIINNGKLLFDGLLLSLVEKYAPYKLIRITLSKKIEAKRIEGLGEIKMFSYPQLLLRLFGKNISKTIAKILKDLPVRDLNIEDPDVEDVIREIFAEKR